MMKSVVAITHKGLASNYRQKRGFNFDIGASWFNSKNGTKIIGFTFGVSAGSSFGINLGQETTFPIEE